MQQVMDSSNIVLVMNVQVYRVEAFYSGMKLCKKIPGATGFVVVRHRSTNENRDNGRLTSTLI